MNFIQLRSFDNYIEANIVLNMLRDNNVNCHLKDEHLITIDPLLSPAIGGMKLMVHPSHVQKAWNLMEEAEQRYLRSVPCPVCKAHQLKRVSITKKHKCWLSALASMLLTGQPIEVSSFYSCESCGYDFKELPQLH